jgi:hypothetical protein
MKLVKMLLILFGCFFIGNQDVTGQNNKPGKLLVPKKQVFIETKRNLNMVLIILLLLVLNY